VPPAGRQSLALLAPLERPSAVLVDLSTASRFPLLRHAAALDRLLLSVGEPRPTGFDDRGVDNLTARRQMAALAQHLVEPGEQSQMASCSASLTNRMNDSWYAVWLSNSVYSTSRLNINTAS
jgi:hypothetical protein